VPVDPNRDGVLHDQDRQQDRGRLQGRQNGREERRRDHPDAGKAALAEPERRHRDDGKRIEQRIGDDVHAGGGADRERSDGLHQIKAQPRYRRQSY
jgi:hypothetical protein